MIRTSQIAVAILALLMAAPIAEAQDKQSPKERATKLVREAADLYDQGDRLGAVARFEKAYSIYPSAVILYNLGKAYRGVGRNALAHRTLSRFLRDAKNVDAGRRAEIERSLRNVEGVIGLLRITVSAPGMMVSVDGDKIGKSPLPGVVAVEPGVHLVTVSHKNAQVASKQVAAGTGKTIEVSLTVPRSNNPDTVKKVPDPKDAAKRVPDPQPDLGLSGSTPSKSKPVYKKWWFWTAVGVAAIGATALAVSAGGGSTINDVDPSLGEFDFGRNF